MKWVTVSTSAAGNWFRLALLPTYIKMVTNKSLEKKYYWSFQSRTHSKDTLNYKPNMCYSPPPVHAATRETHFTKMIIKLLRDTCFNFGMTTAQKAPSDPF